MTEIEPMKPAGGRVRRKAARPGELLAAALDVFSERGFAAARIDDIAARAGVSKGTVFLYYETKQALFRAVVEAAVLPRLDAGEALLTQDGRGPAELLRALLEECWSVLGEPRIAGIPKLVMAEAGNFPEIAAWYHERVVLRSRAIFAEIFARGVASGEFLAGDPVALCHLALAPLFYVSVWRDSLAACDEGRLDFESFVRTHLDVFMRGILVPCSGGNPQ